MFHSFKDLNETLCHDNCLARLITEVIIPIIIVLIPPMAKGWHLTGIHIHIFNEEFTSEHRGFRQIGCVAMGVHKLVFFTADMSMIPYWSVTLTAKSFFERIQWMSLLARDGNQTTSDGSIRRSVHINELQQLLFACWLGYCLITLENCVLNFPHI